MKIVTIVISLLTLLIVSCTNSDKAKNKLAKNKLNEYSIVLQNKNLLIIDLDTLKKSIGKYSSFYSSVRYVPLETTKESLIGKIEHIELFNDTLLVFDSNSAKAIFEFDLSGKFIRKIGKVGRGPGEWAQPVSFSVDRGKSQLLILDGALQKILKYSMSGKFLGQISLSYKEIRSHCVECYNGQIFLDARKVPQKNSNSGYLLREIDTDGRTINSWFDALYYNKGWDQGKNPWYFSGSGTLFSSPSGIKYADLFMDTIYSINANGIRPFIAIKTKNQFTAEKIKEMLVSNPNMNSFLNAARNENGIYAIRSYIENDDIIRFIFSQGRNDSEIIINKKDTIPVRLNHFMNDIIFRTEHDMYYPDFFCAENKLIVGLVPNLKNFQECLKKEPTNLKYEEKMRLLSIQPTDNPVLIILHTK